MNRGARALGFSCLLLALLCGASCGSTGDTPDDAWRDAPASPSAAGLAPGDLRALDDALLALSEGRTEVALALLEPLARARPDHMPVGIWLQETRLAHAVARGPGPAGPLSGGPVPAGEGSAALLRRAYREQAEREPTVARLVLAARLESDPLAAELLLDRALAIDPRSVWAHYGRAHVLASRGDYEEARRALDAAFDADPGHLPARRLSAWILARTGRLDEAARELEAWLESSADDLLARPEQRDEARLDLALMLLESERGSQAARRLAELEGGRADEGRRLAAVAVALEARGDHRGALAAARRAAAADPRAVLPLVQEALILERRLDDPEGALAAWERVLELGAAREDLGALLQQLRARVHLERLHGALDADGAAGRP